MLLVILYTMSLLVYDIVKIDIISTNRKDNLYIIVVDV